jgi:hypothetical protein
MNKRQTALVEQDFFAVLLHVQLTGESVDATIEALTSVSKPTWYRRKKKNPELYQQAATRAAEQALSLRKGMQTQLLQRRMTAELLAQTAIVDETLNVVKRVIEIAQSKSIQPQHAVAAARTLSAWGKGGVIIPLVVEEVAKVVEELGYDPNVPIEPSQIMLPPGSEVTIKTPEVVDAVPIGTS